METTDSTNITCPSCGHGIDSHHPDEDAIIDACWAVVSPAADGDPEGLCPCSLRPSEIAGGLLAHAREGILALLAEVERLRAQLDVTMQLPTGQVSNHYKAAHWDAFRVHERENAAAWDGHTPEVAAERMERCVMGEW